MWTLLLDLAGERVGDRKVGFEALGLLVGAAFPIAGLVAELRPAREVDAGRSSRDVDQLGLLAVGSRARNCCRRTGPGTSSWWAVRHGRGDAGIGLNVLARIVVERLAGLLVDALGPVDVLEIGLGQQGLPVVALHGVEEAVAGRMRDQLARLAVDLAVDRGCACRPRRSPNGRRACTGSTSSSCRCRGPRRSRCWCRGCRRADRWHRTSAPDCRCPRSPGWWRRRRSR